MKKEQKRAEAFVEKLKDLIIDCFTEQNLQEFYVLVEEKILSHVQARKDLETFKMCIFQQITTYFNWAVPDNDLTQVAVFKAFTQVEDTWKSFEHGEHGVGIDHELPLYLVHLFMEKLEEHWNEDHPDIIMDMDNRRIYPHPFFMCFHLNKL